MSDHDLTVCMTLKSIHTMNAGSLVELKFVLPRCGEVDGGELHLRITPESGTRYMLGDKLTLHIRGAI